MKKKITTDLRIIWAIATKDLLDAIKNRHVLAVVIPAIFVVILYRFIPAMNAGEGPARLRILDAGNPAAAAVLETSPAYRPIYFEDLETMQYSLTNEEQPEIGLVLPHGFDRDVVDGDAPVLQGYMLSFFSMDAVQSAESALERDLAALFGTRVDVRIEQIPLLETSYGITVLNSLGLTFVIMIVGIVALPQLILEEKHEKTLEFLLVTPARSRHVILAKTLTGTIITFLVFVIAVVVFQVYFVHWGLLLLTGVLGTAFSVSLGLALGLIINSRQQLTLWGGAVLVPFALPMLMVVMEDFIPERLVGILQWLPSVAIMRLIRTAMAETFTRPYYAPQLMALMIGTAAVLLFDTWLVRRLDR